MGSYGEGLGGHSARWIRGGDELRRAIGGYRSMISPEEATDRCGVSVYIRLWLRTKVSRGCCAAPISSELLQRPPTMHAERRRAAPWTPGPTHQWMCLHSPTRLPRAQPNRNGWQVPRRRLRRPAYFSSCSSRR
jgi:hypothetical protein